MLLTYPTTRLSLCAQVIDWCLCARVFSCPVGKACLVLFRKAVVIVTRCRLFGGGHPVEGHPAQIHHDKFIGNAFGHMFVAVNPLQPVFLQVSLNRS
jgi:hypothetical protein